MLYEQACLEFMNNYYKLLTRLNLSNEEGMDAFDKIKDDFIKKYIVERVE